MSEVRIAAEPRTEFGKGAARRVRRANKVPAVLYGHGDAPRHYSLPGHELMLALKHDANQLLTLQTEDGDQLVLTRSSWALVVVLSMVHDLAVPGSRFAYLSC